MSMDRRELLAFGSRLFLSRFAVPQLLAWTATGLARNAYAQQSSAWNYVNLHCGGGPNRWTFDQWMRISMSDPMIPTPLVSTAFSGGVPTYQTYNVGGYQVPHLWSLNVARGDGSPRPMQDLLSNMAILRGWTTGVDGHSTNTARQTQPLPGNTSLGGLVADAFTKSIAAIGVRAAYGVVGAGYQSAKGLGQTVLSTSTLGRELMAPFDKSTYALSPSLSSAKSQSSKALERAAQALMSDAKARDPGAAALGDSVAGAKALIARGVSDLDAFWTAAVARYKTAINGSMQPQVLYPSGMPGITVDLANPAVAITSDGTHTFDFNYDKVYTIDAGVTAASLLANATITYLAEMLALAEYALMKGLTSSIELPVGFVDGLSMPSMQAAGAIADSHNTGAAATLMIASTFYRGLSGGLLTLVDALKSYGLFNNTLIHITGDFSRVPRDGASDSGHGSDHGFDANVTSLISGAVDGPLVVGNIRQAPTASYATYYPGTWGQAAPIAQLGGMPGPGHVAASIASLMQISKNPWTATPPLLKLVSGKAQPTVDTPRMIS